VIGSSTMATSPKNAKSFLDLERFLNMATGQPIDAHAVEHPHSRQRQGVRAFHALVDDGLSCQCHGLVREGLGRGGSA